MNADSPRREECCRSAPASVFHDLNNALTPVLAYAELLAHRAPAAVATDGLSPNREKLRAAAQRAARLARQLRDTTCARPPLDTAALPVFATSACALNNALAAVAGFTQLERNGLPATDSRRTAFDEILHGCCRAADLVRHLSREQPTA